MQIIQHVVNLGCKNQEALMLNQGNGSLGTHSAGLEDLTSVRIGAARHSSLWLCCLCAI